MENATPARRTLYAGLFLVTLATLTYEILLTRIFSVTMMYHFAFMAVSVAMFGMTTGALVVYLRPGYFSPNTTRSRLALSALLFSLSMVFSFLTHLCIPFTTQQPSLVSLFALAVNYVLIAIPFGFSGIC